jgi:hypothetical protein
VILFEQSARAATEAKARRSSKHFDSDGTKELRECLLLHTLEDTMFKVIAGLIALGGVALATPAVAQGVYLGNSGVSVGIGERDYDRGYQGYDNRPRYRSYGSDSYAYGRRCETVQIVRSNGRVKTIRRCH